MNTIDAYDEQYALLSKKNDTKGILKLARLAVEDGHDSYRIRLAGAAYKLKSQDALGVIEDALAHFPDHPNALNWCALLLEQEGDYVQALGRYERLAEVALWYMGLPMFLYAKLRFNAQGVWLSEQEVHVVHEQMVGVIKRVEQIPARHLEASSHAIAPALEWLGEHHVRHAFNVRVFKHSPTAFNARRCATSALAIGYNDDAQAHVAHAMDADADDLYTRRAHESLSISTGRFSQALERAREDHARAPSVAPPGSTWTPP